jgi:hypothetical protein
MEAPCVGDCIDVISSKKIDEALLKNKIKNIDGEDGNESDYEYP